MQTKTERFEMRLDQDVLDSIDGWRSKEKNTPSRAEAIRRLISIGLAESGEPQPRLSDGEQLILLMLRDLFKHQKLKSEIDPDFIAETIWGGHSWALDWQYPGIFHNHADRRETVTEVVNILDMWSFIERGYAKLSAKDKERVAKEAGRSDVQFIGFDGNNESEHRSVALFLINRLDRFGSFKGRDLNSHCPIIDRYRRMVANFEPVRKTLIGAELSASQIIELLNSHKL